MGHILSNLLGTLLPSLRVGKGVFDTSGLTAQRTITVPDADGTLAMLSDLGLGGNPLEVGYYDTHPAIIPHRGGALLQPEHTTAAYDAALAAGFPIIEADIRVSSDGIPFAIHDESLVYATTSSGNVSTTTAAALDALVVDAATWFGGGASNTVLLRLSTLLSTYAGEALFCLEAKTTASVLPTISALQAASVPLDGAIIQASTLSDLGPVVSAGFTAMLVLTATATTTPTEIRDAGVEWVAVSADMPVATMQMHIDAGLKLVAWSIGRRFMRNALPSGARGYFADDYRYLAGSAPLYATDNFATQQWQPGMLPGINGVDTRMASAYTSAAERGRFLAPDWFGFPDNTTGTYRGVLMGHMCPVGGDPFNRSYYIQANVKFVSESAASWVAIFISSTDRPHQDSGSQADRPLGYHFILSRTNGFALYRVDATTSTLVVFDNAALVQAFDTEVMLRVEVTPTTLTFKLLNAAGTVTTKSIQSTDVTANYRGGYFHIGRKACAAYFRAITTGPL